MASFTYVTVAQAIAVGGSAWLSGNIAALSLMAIPGLRKSSNQHEAPSSAVVKQWRHIYAAGAAQNPPIAGALVLAFAVLSRAAATGATGVVGVTGAVRSHGRAPLLYAVAGALTFGIVPFTLTAMAPTNNRLKALSKDGIVDGQQEARDEEIDRLLAAWTGLNAVRSLFPLAGAIVGFVAALA